MRIRFAAPGLVCTGLALTVATLSGCGSSGSATADGLLAGAHASLEEDDTASAREWLASAKTVLTTARETKEYDLLAVELEVRSGRAERAMPTIERLLATYPRDPRVHEVAGKAWLMQGDFAQAGRDFGTAMNAYTDEADAARAADLLALARGFEAYGQGRLSAAEERWAGIADDELRAWVVGASATASGSDRDAALARNNQFTR